MNKLLLSSLGLLPVIGLNSDNQYKPFNGNHNKKEKPNIIIIYADDLGYGDLSCYGATKIRTPNTDKLAAEGILFANAHATASISTPSRYSLLTGEYAWRRENTGIAKGDASAIIGQGKATLPKMLQYAGYKTGVVGKWHLGLGLDDGPDWNSEIKPGPLEIGFDYAFLIPATGDRVPCVFVENHRIVGLESGDPIRVSYLEPVGDEPTGKNNPELLKMLPSHGHDQTIINGISRIGYMSGGKSAQWTDEHIASEITSKAKKFILNNRHSPFFLYFATHDIHVPRVPDEPFAGKSGMGPRGDVILQFDWCVGEIMETLDSLKLLENTIVILSSDNGPAIDDGYQDMAVKLLNGHKPSGIFRGGKYSAFDGGTRIPFIIYWKGKIKHGKSDALICQLDLFSSFARMTGQKLSDKDAPDSFDELNVLLGKSTKGREYVIEQSLFGTLSVIKGKWKYIEPHFGPKILKETNTELGNDTIPQLYDLTIDGGEMDNIASKYPEKNRELANLLEKVKASPKTR